VALRDDDSKKGDNLEAITHKVSPPRFVPARWMALISSVLRQVFFDVSIGGEPAGRIVMGLFGEVSTACSSLMKH
jgi:hypothetical protein